MRFKIFQPEIRFLLVIISPRPFKQNLLLLIRSLMTRTKLFQMIGELPVYADVLAYFDDMAFGVTHLIEQGIYTLLPLSLLHSPWEEVQLIDTRLLKG